ncbi:MAG TPA: methylated-DNA--[protein]-cysteine S-methyltransferase [Gemmatimonadaceae bacterium]|nr:methylated-DNA--[protein]-cysteine S-methyltransferase [Gemmatimonadaceae bacterium]
MTAATLLHMPVIETVPLEETRAESAVLRARDLLDAAVTAGREGRVPLQELARAVDLSAAHLQRLFTEIVGVSPSAYLRSRRADSFRRALRETSSVSAATFDAGYAASSRAYADASRHLGMTPSAYRSGGAGMTIRWAATDTPLGRLVIGATERGLCWVSLAATDATLVQELGTEFPRASIVAADDGSLAVMLHAVVARLAGDRSAPDVAIDMQVTAFQQRVLDALIAIPFGETRSYAQIAAAIGKPGAARAVANACATNRVAVVIPCHRVIHSDGSMSGYRWGNQIKKALLQAEGAALPRGDGAAPAAVRRRRAS